MPSLPHQPICGCAACTSGHGRRHFLKNLGITGAVFSGLPQVAGALTETGSRDREWSRSSLLRQETVKRISILHTADIHAQLYTHDEFFWENNGPVYKKRGGMAVLKTMLNTLRKENPGRTLLVDGGDCFQGSGVAALSEGRAIVPLINDIGYDLMLPGNWEVVYGKEMMQKDLGAYDAQKVCANMFHHTSDERNGELLYHPYWITHFGDIKLGFIGYNDPLTPKRQSPAYSEGITFTKPEKNVARYIRILRDYERCDMVFLVTHMGLAQQVDLANQSYVDGVDFILGADTHERVREPLQGKFAQVTEPGAFGSFVSKLDLIIENGKIRDVGYQLLDVDPVKYKPDADMMRLVENVRAPFEKELNKVIGKTKTNLVRYYVLENPMDNMITDAIQWKFKPDIAMSNGFRFCPPLVTDPQTGIAEITNDFLWNMLPVDSQAKTGEITGRQVWDWLEKELHNVFAKNPAQRFGGWVVRFAGMEINFTAGNEMGKRLNWVKIKGTPIDLTKWYTVVACEREGDPDNTLCRVENVSKARKLGTTLHEIMREYLAAHSPVSPRIEKRVTATDVPQNLLSQLEGYPYTFR